MATELGEICAAPWDVLVIGAGPAGAVAASTTASHGARTLLVERQRFPRPKVCGGCLAPAGVRVLQERGLGGALARAGAQTVSALRLQARGVSARLPIKPYVTVDRSSFDAALAAEAQRCGVRWLDGVCAAVGADGLVRLEGRDGAAQIQPAVVIVADGLGGSSLADREEFSWRIDRTSPVGVGAIVDEKPEHAAWDEITMVCGKGGYVGAAPIPGGRWTIAAALAPSLVRECGPAGAIARILGESGLRPPEVARGAWRGAGNLTRGRRRVASGRVLIVGDASGYVEPLTGEGMSWAMACAARIAPYADAAARGEDVAAAWRRECASLLGPRRLVCRAVCALAARPALLAGALRTAQALPLCGRASAGLCWSRA